ncbi:MAG TPA: glycosyltransferase family 4 protein [Elusimicrobiota bacterium]|nr:glycosyltransferase family 4 protein [Elusimicrobiota bacterium]
MKPTVVHACDYASDYGGNFIASLSRLRETTLRDGWRFALLLPHEARERAWCRKLAASGWDIRFFPKDASAARCALLLARLALQENIRLVHTHFSRFDAAAWLAAKIALVLRGRAVPVVWHCHSDFPVDMSPARKIKDLIKFRWLGGAVHIIVVSEHLKERPLSAGFDARRLHLISNGIDLSRLDGREAPPDAFGRMAARKDTAVLMFGWHPSVKGVDVALAAFEIAARQRVDLRLFIVGTERLRSEVARIYPNGAPAWLRLLPPVDDVAEYFRGAGIFLSASRREGFSYSVFEAAASRCLLVSSDIAALRWAKDSIRCGWFRNEDPVELAARIVECASLSEADRQEAARVNADFVRKHLSVEKWAEAVSGAYAGICPAGSGDE